MNLFTLDWETYYDKEYSLSKLSTEDYVADPRFHCMLVTVKRNAEPTQWFSGTMRETRDWLLQWEIHKGALLCQNTMFDQLINQFHFGIYPKILLDTMCMAQALLKPYLRSVSLGSILDYLKLGVKKGTYVQGMAGRTRESLSLDELHAYAAYSTDDTEGTYAAFQHMRKIMPKEELEIIDLTLRMYFEPQLELDANLLHQILMKVRQDKNALVAKLPPEIQRADLMSNVKLAALLEHYGVDIPKKISPATGKSTYAFAKNDVAWLDMVEEYADDPILAPILAARSSEKSTLIETRSERLLEIARKYKKFRVPLKYYAALTGRYGGTQNINVQNFNRVNPKLRRTDQPKELNAKGVLEHPLDRRQIRFAIRAPKHHVILTADFKQIEARTNAWESGCKTLVNAFALEKDIYSEFASTLFRRTITKKDEKERFVGKTCILGLGYGMGAPKLKATLRTSSEKLKVDDATCAFWVDTYRSMYREIPGLWDFCDDALEIMAHGGKRRIGPCMAMHQQIELPNGMNIVYNNLRWLEGDTTQGDYKGWVYDFGGMTRTIWGGKVVENITQALTQIIAKNAMRAIRKRLRLPTSMQAHDELVFVVLEKHAPMIAQDVEAIMIERPWWAPDLPIGVETKFGETYGDAK